MQDRIGARLRAGKECAQPCVEREGAEEAQCCARFRDQDCQSSNRRYCACIDQGCGAGLCDGARCVEEREQLSEERGEGRRLGLRVCEDVEGVIECGEERCETTRRCEEPMTSWLV